MPFTLDSTPERQVLKFEGCVTIGFAQDLAAKLGEGLEDGKPLVIDTQGLEDIDTSILQLLCSLQKAVATFSIESPSDAFISAVDRCGLRRELLGSRENL